MKVAAIQFAPKLKEVGANLRTAVAMTADAAREGAKLIVLPELVTTGYSFMSEIEAMPFAEDLEDSKTLRVFQALSRKFGVAVVLGLMTKDADHLHNSQVLLTPDADPVVYHKVNQFGNDFLWATPGTSNPPIGTFEGMKVGLLICADVRDKSDDIDTFYEPGDADVVAFSANWGDGGFPAGRWVKFAKQNRCHLIVSNRYGREENNNFGEGGICVISPAGKVSCQGLHWSQPCIVFGDV